MHLRAPLLVLAFTLLAGPGLCRATQKPETPDAVGRPNAPQEAFREAAYQYALGQLAVGEGNYRVALEAYGEAVRLSPDAPYLRLEYGRLLARLGHFAPASSQRRQRFAAALRELAAAERLAGADLDLAGEIGQVYLDLADTEPEALAGAKRNFLRLREERPDDPVALLQLGRIFLAEGDSAEAVVALRGAVILVPGNAWAEAELKKALGEQIRDRLRAGWVTEAEALLAESLALDPEDPDVRMALADVRSRRGDYGFAAETLRPVAEKSADPSLGRRFTFELFRAGELAAAAEVAASLPDDPSDPGRMLGLLVAAAEGRTAEVVARLTRAMPDETQAAGLATSLVRELEVYGHDDRASELLDALLDHPWKDAATVDQLLLERALQLARGERWEAVLEATADTRRRDLGAAFLAVEAHMNLNRGDQALALLDRMPGGADAERIELAVDAKRAELLLRLGRDEEAETLLAGLDQADDAQSQLQLARVLHAAERYDRSIPVLERALELAPDNLEVNYALGSAFERSGQYEEAEASFRRLLAHEPDHAPTLNYLGYMWAERGENLQEALSMIHRAVAMDPDNGAYVDSLGWALYQLGELEGARAYLERAAALVPDDPTIIEHLGDTYLALGESGRAGELYQRCLELKEGNREEQLRRKLAALASGGDGG